MKKVILSTIAIMLMFVMMPFVRAIEKPEVTDHEKVTIYIFRGEGCGHCQNAISYFYSLGDEYADYLEVKAYEVWKNANNASLAKDVAAEVGTSFTGGVPLIVVGEKYVGGFGEGTGAELIQYALDYYQDEEYRDVVEEKLANKSYDETVETIAEAAISEGLIGGNAATQETGKYDTLIIIGIFVVLIGGFAGLVIAGKK
ncbi:MAG: hypothetical protein E7161_04720 [Firmicutes bacterium]|nr:hypothetical protein [Bacillota bacterium]